MGALAAELQGRVQCARGAGRVRVALRARVELTASDGRDLADALARTAGLRALGTAWRALTPEEARAHVQTILSRDLAYSAELMAVNDAAALADDFLNLAGEGSSHWTNGVWPPASALRAAGWAGSWTPATAATFDTGVVAVGPEWVALLWIEDED